MPNSKHWFTTSSFSSSFFLPGVDASHVYVRAWALGCFHGLISTQTFWRALTASVDSCAEIKECPFSGVISAGRRVPDSDARSQTPSTVYDILPLEEGTGKRCWECVLLRQCRSAGLACIKTRQVSQLAQRFPAVSLILFLGETPARTSRDRGACSTGELERLRLLCAPSPVIPRYRNEIRK